MNSEQECIHENFKTFFDVGYDIDETGEERQHIDICQCRMFRMWSIFYYFSDKPEEKHIQSWTRDDQFLAMVM